MTERETYVKYLNDMIEKDMLESIVTLDEWIQIGKQIPKDFNIKKRKLDTWNGKVKIEKFLLD